MHVSAYVETQLTGNIQDLHGQKNLNLRFPVKFRILGCINHKVTNIYMKEMQLHCELHGLFVLKSLHRLSYSKCSKYVYISKKAYFPISYGTVLHLFFNITEKG